MQSYRKTVTSVLALISSLVILMALYSDSTNGSNSQETSLIVKQGNKEKEIIFL